MTKILELANDFSTLYKKYNNEIVQHVLVENSVIDAGLIGNNHVSTASIQLDNTIIRIGTSRGLLDNDLLSYDALQYKFVNKSLAEFGFVGAADIANSITTDTLTANTISVSGDLVVAGNTITLDTQTLLVEDNIIVLAANNNTNITDFGFAGQYSYDNGATTRYAGIFRDASIGKFYLFENYSLEPPTSTMTGFNPSSMSGTLILSYLEVLEEVKTNIVTTLTASDLTVSAPDGNLVLTASDEVTIDAYGGGVSITSWTNVVTITGNLLTSGTYDIGSSGNPWNNIYVDDLTLNTAAIAYNAANGTLDVSGNALAYQSDVATLIADSQTKFIANSPVNAGDTVSLRTDNGKIDSSGLLFSNTAPVKCIATDATGGDYLGQSVAITSSKIFAGAYREDDTGTDAGSAYIFDYSGNQLSKFQPNNSATYDYFGNSMDTNGTILVVGAPYKNGQAGGSAYIFDLDGNQQLELSPNDLSNGDWFGQTVKVTSNRIIVSAPRQNSFVGAVYIFDTSGNQIAKISETIGRFYGEALNANENYIIIGSPQSTNGGLSNCGMVYIYDTDGNFVRQLQPSTPTAYSYFGSSVAISDSKIVVGEAYNDTGGNNRGMLYLFDINGNQSKAIQYADIDDSDQLGATHSLEMTTNYIAIGVKYAEDVNEQSSAGAVYIFDLELNEKLKLKSDTTLSSHFGNSVDTQEDNLVVGAYQYQPGSIGAAFYFNLSLNSNVNNFIGIAKTDIASGTEGAVYMIGDVADNQTGLITNQLYYLQNDGSLTTTETQYGLVGRAVSNTSLKLLEPIVNDYNNLINKPDAQLAALADDAFINSIIFG